jgi:3-oxosteroid 1-dehydrogenase
MVSERAHATSPRWDVTADLVVVGSGIGGLVAAITAYDLGLSVAVVERSDKVGGVTGVSGGLIWVPLTRDVPAGSDSRDAVIRYLEHCAAGFAEPALRDRIVDVGPVAVHYLTDKANIPWQLVPGKPDCFWPWVPGSAASGRTLETAPLAGSELGQWQHRTHRSVSHSIGMTLSELKMSGGMSGSALSTTESVTRRRDDVRTLGEGLVGHLIKAALIDRDIPALTETRAERLVVSGGAVTGVQAVADGKAVAIRARRGVLLATGGYDWDTSRSPEVLSPYLSAAPPIVTGDHLVMAAEIGAAMKVLPPLGLHLNLGYTLPGEQYEGRPMARSVMFEVAQPHAILVNDAGARFCDESFFVYEEARLRAFDPIKRRYTNLPAFVIFDQQHRDRTAFGNIGPGQQLAEPPFVKGNSVAELASRLHVDVAGLESTVSRFNEMCATGVDDDFGRGSKPATRDMYGALDAAANPLLGPLSVGPFYGLEVSPAGLGVNHGGLHINEDAQVLHVRGHAINGLYAAGNAAAHTDYGPVYLSGATNARGLIWGYIAARHAARVGAGQSTNSPSR